MVRRLNEQRSFHRAPGVEMRIIVEPNEMFDAGRMYALITFMPGATLDNHRHDEEMESFFVVKGKFRILDEGDETELNEGDTLITKEGQTHAIFNDTDKPAQLIALIINRKQGVPGSSVKVF